jgi:hypothetical protein
VNGSGTYLPLSFYTNNALAFQYGTLGQFAVGSGASTGTAGQVLTSGGASAAPTWSTPASGGLTLLGTVTTTSGNSVSLGSLDLTSYKYLYISAVGISTNTTNGSVYISASNSQVYGDAFVFSGTSQTYLTYGIYQVDLASGCGFAGAYTQVANSSTYNSTRTDINTATTTIYFRITGAQTFDAGSFIVYGGK